MNLNWIENDWRREIRERRAKTEAYLHLDFGAAMLITLLTAGFIGMLR